MIQDLQQFEETMAKAKTDPEVPPLAVWMMETLAGYFKQSTACTHLNLCVRTKAFTPDEPNERDALFSLHGVDTREADVWVEWSEDETVTVSIITSHGVGAEHVSSVSRWSPHLLVSWLDGASWVTVMVEEAKPAAQLESLATATEGLLDEHAKLQAEHVADRARLAELEKERVEVTVLLSTALHWAVSKETMAVNHKRAAQAVVEEFDSLFNATHTLARRLDVYRSQRDALEKSATEALKGAGISTPPESFTDAPEGLGGCIRTLATARNKMHTEVEGVAKERTEVEQLLSAALYWPSGFSGYDGRNVKARAEQVFERVKKQHGFEQRIFMLLSERVLGRERAEKVCAAARVERPEGASDRCDRCGSLVRVPGPYICGTCEPFSWLSDAETQRAEVLASLLRLVEATGSRPGVLQAAIDAARVVLAKYPEAR